MLAREVLRLRGSIANRETEWDVMVDLYFYRDPEAEENKEEDAVVKEEAPAEPGFGGTTGGADWEVSGQTAFAGATAPAVGEAGAGWEASTEEWGAAAPAGAPGTEWAADAKSAEQW